MGIYAYSVWVEIWRLLSRNKICRTDDTENTDLHWIFLTTEHAENTEIGTLKVAVFVALTDLSRYKPNMVKTETGETV